MCHNIALTILFRQQLSKMFEVRSLRSVTALQTSSAGVVVISMSAAAITQTKRLLPKRSDDGLRLDTYLDVKHLTKSMWHWTDSAVADMRLSNVFCFRGRFSSNVHVNRSLHSAPQTERTSKRHPFFGCPDGDHANLSQTTCRPRSYDGQTPSAANLLKWVSTSSTVFCGNAFTAKMQSTSSQNFPLEKPTSSDLFSRRFRKEFPSRTL